MFRDIMKNFRTEGIVIKRKNIGEADRLLTVFTKDHGKLQIKAAGIRRIASRRSAHVELLNYTSLSLYKGPGVPVLTEATTLENFSEIKNDLHKVGYAYHLCELIDGLCPENQEHSDIFYLLRNMLNSLVSEVNIQQAIHEFEIQLLIILGYWNEADSVSERFDTQSFIENIMERKLKSRHIFTKLQ